MVTPYKTLNYQNLKSFKRPFGIEKNTTKNLWFKVNQNTAITLQVNNETIQQMKYMISFAKQTKLYIPNVFIQSHIKTII